MKKIILATFFSLLFLGLGAQKLQAQDANLTITCSDTECVSSPASGTPLFTEPDIKPGFNVYRNFEVINNGSDTCDLTMYVDRLDDPNNLAQVLLTMINDGDSDLLSENETILSLYNRDSILLGSISPGGSKTYSWLVTMSPDVGDEYQGLTTIFDFDLNFICGQPSPTPTPTSTPDNGTDDSAGDDGEDGAPTPTPTPIPTEATGGLFLGAADSIFPVLGSAVEAVEDAVTPKQESSRPEVAGAQDQCCPKVCPWWWIFLVAQIAGLSIFYIKLNRKNQKGPWWLVPVLAYGLSLTGHLLLHNQYLKMGYQKSTYCQYFWLMSLVVTGGLTLLNWQKTQEGEYEQK